MPQAGIRFITFDFRAHGDTRPLGSVDKLRFASFADDLRSLIDHLGLNQIVVGGVSMGAGVALNFAIRYPDRVRGLILSRPAWLDSPRPANLLVMVRIAGLIRQYGAERGLEHFRRSDEYRALLETAPDVADSLLGQFTQPRAEETVAKLECLPGDAPTDDRAGWTTIKVPTVIFVTRHDPIHPYEYGTTLAQAIPNAVMIELTAKSVNKERHTLETQQHIGEFLRRFLP